MEMVLWWCTPLQLVMLYLTSKVVQFKVMASGRFALQKANRIYVFERLRLPPRYQPMTATYILSLAWKSMQTTPMPDDFRPGLWPEWTDWDSFKNLFNKATSAEVTYPHILRAAGGMGWRVWKFQSELSYESGTNFPIMLKTYINRLGGKTVWLATYAAPGYAAHIGQVPVTPNARGGWGYPRGMSMRNVLEFWERKVRKDGNHIHKRWTVNLPEADGFHAIGQPIYLSDDADLCETYFIARNTDLEDTGLEYEGNDLNNQWHWPHNLPTPHRLGGHLI
jgi:hypothetical protein